MIEISAKQNMGLDDLALAMMDRLKNLRKVVTLRVPQSYYALISDLMKKSHVIQCDYEENDILLEMEIPAHLEHLIDQFKVTMS